MMRSLIFYWRVITHLTGRVGLLLYYRNMKKVRLVLSEKYNNSYEEAGDAMLFVFIKLTVFLLVVLGIMTVLYVWLFH